MSELAIPASGLPGHRAYDLHAILSDRIRLVEDFMSRRWLVYLPLAMTLAGTVALPTAAFAAGHDTPPAPACTKDTGFSGVPA